MHQVERTEPFFFFFTLVTGPRRSLSLKLSDTIVYAPQIRAIQSEFALFEHPACSLECFREFSEVTLNRGGLVFEAH